MERPNYEERLDLIQGVIDRLLYLEEKEMKEFLGYLDAMFCVYPIPRKILYGAEALRAKKEEDKCK